MKVDLKPVTLFATPNNMGEMEDTLAKYGDAVATTAAMMMYNLLVTKYDLYEKESDDE